MNKIKKDLEDFYASIMYLQGLAEAINHMVMAPTSKEGREFFGKVTSQLHGFLNYQGNQLKEIISKIENTIQR